MTEKTETMELTSKERTLIGVALEYYKFSLEEKLSLADDLPEEAMHVLSSTHDDVEKLTKKFLEW